jgi:hypothetical protein
MSENNTSANNTSAVFNCNRYTAQSACEHCGGVIRHENWCITVDRTVYYAYQIVADAGKITVGDQLILHSLGVIWQNNPCQGNCKATQECKHT